jgi:hypothetical protein
VERRVAKDEKNMQKDTSKLPKKWEYRPCVNIQK